MPQQGSRRPRKKGRSGLTWDDAIAIAQALPQVEVATWYGTPGLKVAGKGFARLRTEAEGGLVLMCSLDEKERLLESGEPVYYTTPHYDGFGSILVDLSKVDADALRELIAGAWRIKAPLKLRAAPGGAWPVSSPAATRQAPAPRGRAPRLKGPR